MLNNIYFSGNVKAMNVCVCVSKCLPATSVLAVFYERYKVLVYFGTVHRCKVSSCINPDTP